MSKINDKQTLTCSDAHTFVWLINMTHFWRNSYSGIFAPVRDLKIQSHSGSVAISISKWKAHFLNYGLRRTKQSHNQPVSVHGFLLGPNRFPFPRPDWPFSGRIWTTFCVSFPGDGRCIQKSTDHLMVTIRDECRSRVCGFLMDRKWLLFIFGRACL